ncbi:hypothetical protein CMI47_02980 [Candidatus Pacearchaeota archaeon]|nr:hypothetical protein [Candidatus Pacearchaeota archaeon]|tara:strand:- start:5256 stop:5852 length:597 start_codon:yes stop_codon:yes gene_type:complete
MATFVAREKKIGPGVRPAETGYTVPDSVPGLKGPWTSFFKTWAGNNIDSVRHMEKEPVMAELLDWEYIEGKGWKAIYSIADIETPERGKKDVGLVVHILAPKRGYIGTVRNIIAPKAGIKEEKTLKMVAQGAVENAKGILVAASKGKVKRASLTPKRQDYEARIRGMNAAVLRGAPLFDGVKWPAKTKVDRNWLYLQL